MLRHVRIVELDELRPGLGRQFDVFGLGRAVIDEVKGIA